MAGRSRPVMDGRGKQQHGAHVAIRPEDLEGAAKLLTSVADPRAAVCLAASWMLRADAAELWEPSPDGLVLTASTQEDRFSRTAPEIVATTIATGRAQHVHGGAGSGPMLVEPIRRGRQSVAALLVRWRRAVHEVDPISRGCLTLLTAQ